MSASTVVPLLGPAHLEFGRWRLLGFQGQCDVGAFEFLGSAEHIVNGVEDSTSGGRLAWFSHGNQA
jgi:hypothetical protein